MSPVFSRALSAPASPLRTLILFIILSGAQAWSAQGPILDQLVTGNDRLVSAAREFSATETADFFNDREGATRLLVFACGWVAPKSRHHQDPGLLTAMEAVAERLIRAQGPRGLFDSGNLESPPDTGFILEALAKALLLLRHENRPATVGLRDRLRLLIRRAAPAVAAGGVHTPNHRWGVCSALALAHHLEPDPRYPARISEWLSEGVDQDADGQYSERSPAYSAKVVNPAFLTLAERQGRAELVGHVRRNLDLTWRLTEPDGDVVTIASRRQDQRSGAKVSIAEYYLPARWLAVHRDDPRAAGLAAWIERNLVEALMNGPLDPNWPLPWLLADPSLARPLPPAEALPLDFVAEFPGSGLLRIRRGSQTVTFYGGSDHGAGLGLGSGLATDPTFFTFRRGSARVSARLTPAFFGTGFFHGTGPTKHNDGWRLHQRLAVPYHLPLPEQHRRADGDYPLSADGRFYSKMDFEHRPKEHRTLETEVILTERDGAYVLDLAVTGHEGVPVTLELALAGKGELSGVTSLADTPSPRRASWMRSGAGTLRGGADTTGAHVLREGWGKFTAGNDVIEFGPGKFGPAPGRMEGENYTWTGGTLRAEGSRVYLTGVTPLRHTLNFR